MPCLLTLAVRPPARGRGTPLQLAHGPPLLLHLQLPPNMTEDGLRSMFASYGNITEVGTCNRVELPGYLVAVTS